MDWIISDELGVTVGHVVGWGAAGAMIVGGVAPYIPQYIQIKKTQDAEGFSLYVCLALLIANTLRILFWFGKRYELPLLIQSIVMNCTMFVMIHLCVNVRKKNQIIRARERIFTAQPDQTARWLDQRSGIAGGEKPHRFYDMERKYFWAWTDFQSYVDCMLVFSVLGAAITYLLIEFSPFVELIGFLALFTEAMLGAPQIARNHKNKSTEGMSVSMVIMWTCGDVFKTTYFVLREAPPQFWLCGSLQVSLDVVILFQVWLYRHKTAAARRMRRGD
ncbi:solute carrier family 66 member 2 isoform X2 [Helicoverpa armigera]|uniref:solute carrier family 66 member 2 isoform X2 n=1 Tax=Helicoverpa armigera TaxID=29058 RepID=UPI000B37D905|nr:solute carrier family 66 member 2 isoform X2 [Helicoverpa armigera]XP_047041913.1 solute carrier family 66 member 2 isoform X2 [Helicoverpa zea]